MVRSARCASAGRDSVPGRVPRDLLGHHLPAHGAAVRGEALPALRRLYRADIQRRRIDGVSLGSYERPRTRESSARRVLGVNRRRTVRLESGDRSRRPCISLVCALGEFGDFVCFIVAEYIFPSLFREFVSA